MRLRAREKKVLVEALELWQRCCDCGPSPGCDKHELVDDLIRRIRMQVPLGG